MQAFPEILTLKVPLELRVALDGIALRRGVTMSELMRRAIALHLVTEGARLSAETLRRCHTPPRSTPHG